MSSETTRNQKGLKNSFQKPPCQSFLVFYITFLIFYNHFKGQAKRRGTKTA